MSCVCGTSNSIKDKFSSFTDACFIGDISKMREQLNKYAGNTQALINAPNDEGMTPLHRAAQNGSPAIVEFLIKANADPFALTKAGESPLHIACFHRKREAVVKLLQTDVAKHINLKDRQHEMTPLHVAVSRGVPDIAKVLLDNKANPDLRDKFGNNAIEIAEFWLEQSKNGLSSPSAQHQETFNILQQKIKINN